MSLIIHVITNRLKWEASVLWQVHVQIKSIFSDNFNEDIYCFRHASVIKSWWQWLVSRSKSEKHACDIIKSSHPPHVLVTGGWELMWLYYHCLLTFAIRGWPFMFPGRPGRFVPARIIIYIHYEEQSFLWREWWVHRLWNVLRPSRNLWFLIKIVRDWINL